MNVHDMIVEQYQLVSLMKVGTRDEPNRLTIYATPNAKWLIFIFGLPSGTFPQEWESRIGAREVSPTHYPLVVEAVKNAATATDEMRDEWRKTFVKLKKGQGELQTLLLEDPKLFDKFDEMCK